MLEAVITIILLPLAICATVFTVALGKAVINKRKRKVDPQ